jgi:phage terminase large subunit-like protein
MSVTPASLASLLRYSTPSERARLAYLMEEARYRWTLKARPNQLPPPGNWRTWLIQAGRGFGKTRIGAEWTRASARDFPLVNIIGATADDARDIMIEGESGILACCPDAERPEYLPSKRRLEWPNGARSLIFTADEPERLRGKQHMRLWADEVAAWRHPEAWDQAMLGLRLGSNPQAVATTTPRPTKLIRDLIADPSTVVTRGSTYDNRANLAPQFLDQIVKRYEGTRLGRQELGGELLLDVPGALWTLTMFDERRAAPDLKRVVVAIDPAASSNEESDETGIVVAGAGVDGDWYVLADRSGIFTPNEWAKRAIAAYDEFAADRIVAEVNNGGEMVGATLKTVRKAIPYTAVHASRGKAIRAEPIASLYTDRRVWHTRPFDTLEDQLVNWTPDAGKSPDRLDALVWALTELTEGTREHAGWYAG